MSEGGVSIAGPTRSRIAVSPLLVIAAVAAVVSLGLPWASSLGFRAEGPVFYPAQCHISYDPYGWASADCDPIYSYPGYTYTQYSHFVGYQQGIRVLLPAALVLLVVGLRRRRRPFVITGYAVAVTGLLVDGPPVHPGQVAYVIALAALGRWLHRTGWLSRPGSGRNRPPHASGRG